MMRKKFTNQNRPGIAGLFLFLFFFFSFFQLNLFGQNEQDAKNFNQCKACHTIGGGRLVGPDLKGITKKMPEEWLIKFIKNSQAMVKAGDPAAVKVFNEYNKIPMPSHNLTDAQIKGILLYIKNDGKISQPAVNKTSSNTLGSLTEIKKGAKLFNECKACHTIGRGRLVGPDLKGVTKKLSEEWLIKFIRNSQAMVKAGDPKAVKIFNEYSKIPMPAHNLSDNQIKSILAFINNDGKIPQATTVSSHSTTKIVESSGPVLDETEIFIKNQQEGLENLSIAAIVMGFLLIIVLIDLIFTHYLKAKWVHYVILLAALWILGEWTYTYATRLGRQQYYQPDQPIWFSHKVHAGQNKIDCQYCHFTADRSMHAGIPPASVCMNCHTQVKEGKRTGKKEINKIYAAIKNNKPIKWVQVHNLPDFVYFNHKQHVKVGKLDCKECHGDVAQMDVVAQVKTLSMGWCLDCHRTHKVQFTNNKFYGQYKKLHEDLKSGKIKDVTVKMIGGADCASCHY